MTSTRNLQSTIIRYPIAGEFRISRGAKTEAEVICCEIWQDGFSGRGECVPYRRYGETLESVMAQIAAAENMVRSGASRAELSSAVPAGAARNALDCALWDLEAKMAGKPAFALAGLPSPRPLVTAYTISLDTPERMAEQTRLNAGRALLKIKLGTADDGSRMRAIRRAAPDARLIVDANEGWTEDNLAAHLAIAADCGVSLIEQPLPAGKDEILGAIDHPVAICADESVHEAGDLARLRALYDAVNIKLDKTGGMTAAIAMKTRAEELGFSIMVGCMVGSSLAMAPAVLLAQGVDYVDLDGPLLLAKDCEPGLTYRDSLVFPPERALWG